MFQKKVGSDPCLILTGVEDSGTVTLDQTFAEADVLKAVQTCEVAVVVPVSGGVNKFRVDAVVSGHIYAVGIAGSIDFEETDGVWSGTIST